MERRFFFCIPCLNCRFRPMTNVHIDHKRYYDTLACMHFIPLVGRTDFQNAKIVMGFLLFPKHNSHSKEFMYVSCHAGIVSLSPRKVESSKYE